MIEAALMFALIILAIGLKNLASNANQISIKGPSQWMRDKNEKRIDNLTFLRRELGEEGLKWFSLVAIILMMFLYGAALFYIAILTFNIL